MKLKTTRILVLTMLLIGLFASVIEADTSYSYGTGYKRIAAGIITVGTPDVVPVFDVMNQRDELKPAGWQFYNPRMSSSVNQSSSDYWAVNLAKLSFDEVAKYDVLLLELKGTYLFDTNTRGLLRKFVDAGGMLWIDNFGSGVLTNFFINDISFGTGGLATGAAPGDQMASHPLLNRPFYMVDDLDRLGYGYATVGSNYVGLSSTDIQFYPVITSKGASASRIVCASSYGSGHMVITGESIVKAIVQPVEDVRTVATTAVPYEIYRAQDSDLKLAYNIVNWGSDHTTFHGNPRHAGSSFQDIGSALLPLWSFKPTVPGTPPTKPSLDSSPAILDDMVFYVDYNHVLRAFDLSARRDRDGDGSPDDGDTSIPELRDQSQGTAYDQIWRQALTSTVGTFSSPTAAYVPFLSGGVVKMTPMVFVATGDGTVLAYIANLSGSAFGVPVDLMQYSAATPVNFDSNVVPAPPTYVDGSLYWGDGNGELFAYDFQYAAAHPGSDPVWHVGSASSPATVGPVTASPTVGWIRDTATGTMDQVLYLASTHIENGADGNIRPFPLKVSNEVLATSVTEDGVAHTYATRSKGSKILDNGTWSLYFVTKTGMTPLDKSYVTVPDTATDIGSFTVSLPSGFFTTNLLLKGAALKADYQLDPTPPSPGLSSRIIARTSIESRKTTEIGTNWVDIPYAPVLGAKDIMYFVARTSAGDELYAVQESGRRVTHTVVKWRWTLPGSKFAGYHFVGAPVVSGDMVYCAIASGIAPSTTPPSSATTTGDGHVLAFEADPVFKLSIGADASIQAGTQVTVHQDDALDPTNPADGDVQSAHSAADTQNVDLTSTFSYAPFIVDYDGGKLLFYNMRPSGDTTRDLSNSCDVTVKYLPAGSDTVIPITQLHSAYVATNTLYPGDHWNNLVWSMQLSTAPTSAPVVLGDTLYVGAGADLWAINVAKARLKSPIMQAVVEATTDIATHGTVSSTNTRPITSSISGANGMLACVTADALTVFHNPSTLVADANRIAEIDASGSVIWSCDATFSYAQSNDGSVSSNKAYAWINTPFNRPSVARYAPAGGIVVADTGNNRVVWIAKGGSVLHEIKGFSDPSSVLAATSPLSLLSPTDVNAWMIIPVSGAYPEYHYLIADSGHFRVLEIVSVYNSATGNYDDKVAWATQSYDKLGQEYRYTTARSLYFEDSGSGSGVDKNKWMVSSVISNATPAMYTTNGVEGNNSSIVFVNGPKDANPQIDPNDPTGALTGFVPPYIDPNIWPNPFASFLNGNMADTSIATGVAAQMRLMKNPVLFDRLAISSTEFYDLAVAESGVYVWHYTDSSHPATDYKTLVPYTYTADDYAADMASKYPGLKSTFLPVYGAILPTGSVLLVNKAAVDTSGVASSGEVIELQLSLTDLKYHLTWKAPSSASADLTGIKQPMSAERQVY